MSTLAQIVRLVHQRDRLLEKKKRLIARLEKEIGKVEELIRLAAGTSDGDGHQVPDEVDEEDEVEVDEEDEVEDDNDEEEDDEEEDDEEEDDEEEDDEEEDEEEDDEDDEPRIKVVFGRPGKLEKAAQAAPEVAKEGTGRRSRVRFRPKRGDLQTSLLEIIRQENGRQLDYAAVAERLYGASDEKHQHRVRNLLTMLKKAEAIERLGTRKWRLPKS